MKISTINKLCCPFDKADLKLEVKEQTIDNDVRLGSHTCVSCQRFYPIIAGIPIMSPDEYRDINIEKDYYEKLKLLPVASRIEAFKLIED